MVCVILCSAVILCIAIFIVIKPFPTDAAANLLEKERIVIDTDAGVDDAVAIMTILGDKHISQTIEGITCVRGNTEVKHVSINVLKILKIANRLEIPVYPGASKGLIESPDTGDYYGKDGLGDANYPEAPSSSILQKKHAAVFLASIVNEYPGEVTVLMLGPMTNIALALRLNPQFMNQVKRLIALGGSVKGGGSVKPNVEFNVYMDPHAAAVTMQELSEAGRKMTLVPTDAIRENFIEKQWREVKLGAINSIKINFLNKIESKVLAENGSYWEPFDLYVATILLRPQAVLSSNSYYVDFENEGRITKGVLIVDYYNMLNKTANADIIFSFDKKIIKSVALENLS